MDTQDPTVKRLLADSEPFRKLYAEHVRYEERLAAFARIPFLTPEQEVERKTIQKLKLAGKDQMAALVRAASGGDA